ncbi:hypothetical protein N8089_05035 [Flavobacteriales bacterium]|nr:hypothetical protein [Flavobacteriales bacterium]
MKTKFLYLLIIVFSVSLTSCKKRKAEKGLIGAWDVSSKEGSGIFYLDKKGNGYVTILNNSTNELINDIQINDLDINSHMNNGWIGEPWDFDLDIIMTRQ